MDGEDDEDSAHKRKPWGETFHFCPVALNDMGVLWPGNQETALRLVQTIIGMLNCYHYATVHITFISGIVIASITSVVKKPKRNLQLIHCIMWAPLRYCITSRISKTGVYHMAGNFQGCYYLWFLILWLLLSLQVCGTAPMING